MATQQKFQILANDLTRRLSNILVESVSFQEILDVIEQFTQELKSSEYNITQAKEIVMSGIRGWNARKKKRSKNGQEFYRLAHTTQQERARKKLLEREEWYKSQETGSEEEEESSPRKRMCISEGPRRGCVTNTKPHPPPSEKQRPQEKDK